MPGPIRLDSSDSIDAAKVSLLKLLREKKKISRVEISRITQLSTYQVEGLEGKGSHSHLAKILLYIKALGYKVEDVLSLMEPDLERDGKFLKGILGTVRHEVGFADGVKLSTYLQENGIYFGQLRLSAGQSFPQTNYPAGDMLFVIVQEGTLIVDTLAKRTIHRKNHFLLFTNGLPAELSNGDSIMSLSVLLFFVKYPH